MYIIEFETGIYATKGNGDPSRTLKIENAQRFESKIKAEERLSSILSRIKYYRIFSNPKIQWVDGVL